MSDGPLTQINNVSDADNGPQPQPRTEERSGASEKTLLPASAVGASGGRGLRLALSTVAIVAALAPMLLVMGLSLVSPLPAGSHGEGWGWSQMNGPEEPWVPVAAANPLSPEPTTGKSAPLIQSS